MQHEQFAPETAAKMGCYQCTDPNDVVCFDAAIIGEGVLVICTSCILDAAQLARIGRARIKKMVKAEQAAKATV